MFTYPYLLACKQCPLKVTIVMTNFSVFKKGFPIFQMIPNWFFGKVFFKPKKKPL